jgi:deoxycytidylate deaminase
MRDMPAPQGDPTYIKNKDAYFMSVAHAIAVASSHPTVPGGCVLIRDREVIGDGRSILCSSKVEIDCITYAIATCAKRGTPTAGAVIYSTRYPFSTSVFQAYLMGIKRFVVAAHEWEPYYKDEFRRAARLARELSIAIEPLFEDKDQRFTKNPHELDEFDPKTKEEIIDE